MIEKVEAPRLPPAAAIRQEIAKHRRSLAVMASGLAPVLEMLDAYIVATDARIAALEESIGEME